MLTAQVRIRQAVQKELEEVYQHKFILTKDDIITGNIPEKKPSLLSIT